MKKVSPKPRRNEVQKPKFKVLIAVNDSKIAEKAFVFYMDNFYKEEVTDVVVAYEVQRPVFPPVVFSSSSLTDFPATQVSAISHNCNRLKQEVENLYIANCKKYKLAASKVVTAQITNEKPGPAIIKRALAVKANLIVVGSEILGSSGSTFASVSNYVLLHAHVPVLIFRLK